MSGKALNITIIICLFVTAQFCQVLASDKTDGTEKDFALRVYLPREVTIKDNTIILGQVSIIRGKESLVAKASEITLGRFSVPGQEIIITRPTVLSRLACNGIPVSKVRLTGAEKIKIKQQQQIIRGSEFIKLASSFLKKNPLGRSICRLTPMRIPKDLVILNAGKDIKLSPRLTKSAARNYAKVQITVLADGKEIGIREAAFRLKYNCRTAVTLVDIPAGVSISPKDVKIEKTLSNYPEPANWGSPYGLIAKRRIPGNTTIRPYMVGPVNPPVIVKRNRTVSIRIQKPGLLITATGKAIEDGRAGEYIKVRNVDSQRIILAKINKDGTVEPVF